MKRICKGIRICNGVHDILNDIEGFSKSRVLYYIYSFKQLNSKDVIKLDKLCKKINMDFLLAASNYTIDVHFINL